MSFRESPVARRRRDLSRRVDGVERVTAAAQVLFEHYDESSGAHAGIDDILKAAGAA